MEDKRDREKKEGYQVIQEKIVPKKKSGEGRKIGKKLLSLAAYAVFFGLIAAVTLVFSGKFLIEKLGLEKVWRQVVEIGGSTPTPVPVPTQAPNTDPGSPTEKPVATKAPDGLTVTPHATPKITISIGGSGEDNPADSLPEKDDLQGLLEIYSGVSGLANRLEKSLVRITAVKKGVDWFEESYEERKHASGLYVGDNGVDMLFLVNLDSIDGATSFEITFGNGKTCVGSIYAYDTYYRLAVLSVRLSIGKTIGADGFPEKAVFASESVSAGMPVLILGNPNGTLGAIEFGLVTNGGRTVKVVDDEVHYFTTGVAQYADGDGFMFNLSGEVIGMVNSTLNNGENGVFTAMTTCEMKDVIEKTLNNMPRVYCGMRLETVDEEMRRKNNLPDGIYVTEVLPSSPAIAAGLKNGDIILKVEETEVQTVRQFYKAISEIGSGKSIRIVVNRETKGERKEQTIQLTPETRMH